jgi:oligopeptide transport system ATP-binding protein
VLARLLMALIQPTSGTVLFQGRNLFEMNRSEMFEYRRNVQMIYQNPLLSLNPRRTVGESIELPMRNFKLLKGDRKARKRRVAELLETVGLNPYHGNRYPHEFSGGQVQRIGIARALASKANVLVLDEAVSALDVSIQAQILNLLRELREEFDLTYLFIASNLNVIEHVSDRVAVLYRGRIVELAPAQVLFDEPLHPHTEILMAAILSIDRSPGRLDVSELVHEVESAKGRLEEGGACGFATVCGRAQKVCYEELPELRRVDAEHFVACHQVPVAAHAG